MDHGEQTITMAASKPISKLKKEFDSIFSRWVRYSVAKNGMAECYTCRRIFDVKSMQASHFVPRQYLSTRFDERNVKAACYACNMLYGGQPSAFANRLTLEYGPGIISELEMLRRKTTKLTPLWYEEQIKFYKEKVKSLL
jgi:hypothetical protein